MNEILHPGQGWSRILRRGQQLRLIDDQGKAAVAALLYNAHQPLERYNMPDTLKGQHTAFLTVGRVLYSDMGHVLCSITEDGCGWHDTVSGFQDAAESLAKYGSGTYQDKRNERYRNTQDNLLVELAKHGLGVRDLHANVNWFVKMAPDDQGRLSWVPQSLPGRSVTLRMEMDVLLVLSNTPHPADPSPIYAPPPVRLELSQAKPVAADDRCRTSRPENGRAFQLTEALFPC